MCLMDLLGICSLYRVDSFCSTCAADTGTCASIFRLPSVVHFRRSTCWSPSPRLQWSWLRACAGSAPGPLGRTTFSILDLGVAAGNRFEVGLPPNVSGCYLCCSHEHFSLQHWFSASTAWHSDRPVWFGILHWDWPVSLAACQLGLMVPHNATTSHEQGCAYLVKS